MDNEFTNAYALCSHYFHRGKYDEARGSALLLLNSLHPLHLNLAGWVLYRSGDPVNSKAAFCKSQLFSAVNSEAVFGLAVLAMDAGDAVQAFHFFSDLRKRNRLRSAWLFSFCALTVDIAEPMESLQIMEEYCSLRPSVSPYEISILQILRAVVSNSNSIDLPTNLLPVELLHSIELFFQHPHALLFGCRGTGLRTAVEQIKLSDELNLEFGTWRGASALVLAKALHGKDLHCFDSLHGLAEDWGEFKAGSYCSNGIPPCLPCNTILHVGRFEHTLADFLITRRENVAFIHIDCDTYESTSYVLNLISPRIRSGTVILFDEFFMHDTWETSEYLAFMEWTFKNALCYKIIALSPFTRQAILIMQ